MKKIDFKEDKKKIIIAALIAVLCICMASGAITAISQKRNAHEATQASSAFEATEASELQDESNTTETDYEAQAPSESQTQKATEKTTRSSEKQTSAKSTLPETQKSTQPEIKKVTVTVTINCRNAAEYGKDVPDYFVSGAKYTAEEGATVFDALEKVCADNGLALEYKKKTYIEGIGGLKEMDCGSSSGWTYRVNGELVMKAASKCELKDGDRIEWIYITNASQ